MAAFFSAFFSSAFVRGWLLMYDALQMSFKKFNIRRDKDCPVCGDNPSITELIDYVAFCSGVNLEELPEEVAAK